jgi:hypothetical protein
MRRLSPADDDSALSRLGLAAPLPDRECVEKSGFTKE